MREPQRASGEAKPSEIVPYTELISPVFESFSLPLAEPDDTLSIYLHRPAGPVDVRGGEFGPQTIEAVAMDDSQAAFIKSALAALDPRLRIDFVFVDQPELADIRYYLDSTIELGDGGNTLGIALSNPDPERPFWELIFNMGELSDDPLYQRFALLHETGHALGLEHPFDASDGDVYRSDDFTDSATADQTLMAYAESRTGEWPTAYTNSDIAALEAVWGPEDDSGSSQLIGGDGPDRIIGSPAADDIFGYGGADQLLGALGSNRYSSPADGSRDLIGIERDGSRRLAKAAGTVDVITAIGREDRIAILDGNRRKLRFRPVTLESPLYGSLSGTGIFHGGALEAIYTGPDLSLRQISRLTTALPADSLG